MRDGLDFRGLPHRFIRPEPPLRLDQVRSKNGVHERGFPKSRLPCQKNLALKHTEDTEGRKSIFFKTRLTDDNNIELETPLEQLVLDLLCDRVETDV
jgi:hypothetical protein